MAYALTGGICIGQTPEIALTRVAGEIGVPTDIAHAGDGSGRLFIVQRSGLISILKNGVVLPSPFLDIRALTKSENECGLLGMAFPPGFATKRYFYVSYTDTNCQNSVIARYRVSPGSADLADPGSAVPVLTVPQPAPVHNGGQIRFGPDGFLYISFGDGGTGGDPQNLSQTLSVLNGKILRIDTEGATIGPYRVPPNNPFNGNPQARSEIWAYGLRNPWRFSFDRQTGDLWIGDVGQDQREEIDFQPAGSPGGQNYGWRIMEGNSCYSPSTNCPSAGLTPPVLDYGHNNGDVSIIGGFVYRGTANPGLRGTYVYGDFGSGRIWGLRPNGQGWANRLLIDTPINMSTFGEDEAGELYVASAGSAEMWRIGPLLPAGAPAIVSPSPAQNITVSAVTFQWQAVTNATGWLIGITAQPGGATVFQGVLSGANVLSTLVNLPDGSYQFSLRGCNGGYDPGNCGPASTVPFTVNIAKPATAPSITAPSNGAAFTISTLQFTWTAVAGVSGYEVELTDVAGGGLIELSTGEYGNPPGTSTIASVKASTNYQLRVRACTAGCGPWSAPVSFSVALPAVPGAAPGAPNCTLQNGQTASCSWNSVAGADIYILQAIQPAAGPGGGALSVASRRVSTTNTPITVPPGLTSFIVAACNGNGCGPYSNATNLTPAGPAPAAPILANPVPGPVDGPTAFFSWTRIPGDDGTNTVYRLYVQDFLRAAPALDVLTKQNYWAAKLRAGGSRYDALVIANPGGQSPAQGPASGFVVKGTSPVSPTMVAPRHQTPDVTLTVPAGNVQLGWTPVPNATLYEYLIAIFGQPDPVTRGVTPGLQVQIPLTASQSLYSGIVRACPAGLACSFGSDANWGPWSSAPDQTGVTSFLVGP